MIYHYYMYAHLKLGGEQPYRQGDYGSAGKIFMLFIVRYFLFHCTQMAAGGSVSRQLSTTFALAFLSQSTTGCSVVVSFFAVPLAKTLCHTINHMDVYYALQYQSVLSKL